MCVCVSVEKRNSKDKESGEGVAGAGVQRN